MYSKPIIYNELGKNEYSVWSKVNKGIDPSQWASVCRKIGNLSPREFEMVVALVDAHKSLKNALKGHIEGIMGIEGQEESSQGSRHELPILSVGPSGINGEFQREVSIDKIGKQESLDNENIGMVFNRALRTTW